MPEETTIGSVVVKLAADVSDLQQGFTAALAEINKLSGGLGDLGKAAAEAMGIGFSGRELFEFAKASIEAYSQIERLTVSMTYLMHGSEQAAAAIEGIEQQAQLMGYAFEPVLRVSQEFAAFGLSGEEIVRTMANAADVASAMGKSAGEAAAGIERMATSGMISARFLRQMGITVSDVARTMGMSMADAEKAFRGLDVATRTLALNSTIELSRMQGAHQATMDTMSAATERFGNALLQFKESTGRVLSPLGKMFVDFGAMTLEVFAKFETHLADLGKTIEGLVQRTLRLNSALADTRKAAADVRQQQAFQDQAEAKGTFYEAHTKRIDAAGDAAQSAINLRRIEVDAQLAQGKIGADRALEQQKDLITEEERNAQEAFDRKMALQKGDQSAEITFGLQSALTKRLATLEEQRARLETHGATEREARARATAQAVSGGEEKLSVDVLRAQQERYQHEEQLGLVSAEDNAKRLYTNNEAMARATVNGLTQRMNLLRAFGDEEKKAALGEEITAAHQRASEERAKITQHVYDVELESARRVAQMTLEEGRRAAAASLTDRRTELEAQQRLGLAHPREQAPALRKQAGDVQAQAQTDADLQLALDEANGVRRQEREQRHNDAIAESRRQLSQRLKAIDLDVALAEKRTLDDLDSARKATLTSDQNLAIARLEASRQQAELEVSLGRLSAEERLTIERDLNAKERTLQTDRLTNELHILDQLHSGDENYASQRTALTSEIARLGQTGDIEAQLEPLKRLSDAYRAMGITSLESLRSQLANADQLVASEQARVSAAAQTVSELQTEGATQDAITAAVRAQADAQYDLERAQDAQLDKAIQLADAQDQVTSSLRIQKDVSDRTTAYQKDQAQALFNIYKDFADTFDGLWTKFADGFAEAIVQGKKFGDIMMGVVKDLEKEILSKLIGSLLNQLRDLLGKIAIPALGKIGGGAPGGTTGITGKVHLGGGGTPQDKAGEAVKVASEKTAESAAKLGGDLQTVSSVITDQEVPALNRVADDLEALLEWLQSNTGAMTGQGQPQAGAAFLGVGSGQESGVPSAGLSPEATLPHTGGGLIGTLAGPLARLGTVLERHLPILQKQSTVMTMLDTHLQQSAGATGLNTTATASNTGSLDINSVELTGNTLATIFNTIAVMINTGAKIATLGLFQHGGVVPGAHGAPVRAVVHGGELVANESMMRELGTGMAAGTSEGVMRNIAGLTAGSTANASAAAARAIGEQLSGRGAAAGGGGTVSFDGAVFHGVPDQRYVNNIMDTAVRSLRNSSRTWAFNPTGQ